MEQRMQPPDWVSIVDSLQKNPKAIEYAERLQLAERLGTELHGSPPTPPKLLLCHLWAKDPRPEVRKKIANLLYDLPYSEATPLAGLLKADCNAYVKHAAEYGMERQEKRRKEAERRRRANARRKARFENLAKRHSPQAAREACALAEKQFSTLVGTVAHDARAIWLNVGLELVGILRQTKAGPSLSPEHYASLIRMKQKLEHLERYFNDLQVYANMMEEPVAPERIRLLVDEAVTIVRSAPLPPEAAAVPVGFVVDVPENLTAEVTRYQLVATLIHLLTNAREALAGRTDGTGRVVITSGAQEPDMVEITISDNGRGIDPENLADFREFRLGVSSKRQGGRGFGLSTAARYMAYHDGSLDLNSTEGVGTVVKLRFPRKGKGV